MKLSRFGTPWPSVCPGIKHRPTPLRKTISRNQSATYWRSTLDEEPELRAAMRTPTLAERPLRGFQKRFLIFSGGPRTDSTERISDGAPMA
jgi:hypothetical protein